MNPWRWAGWRLVGVGVALAACAAPAVATPQDVIADWTPDGVIDGDYSITDLHDAKRFMAQTDPFNAGGFAVAVDERIDAIFGIDPPRDPVVTPEPDIPDTDVPTWVLVGAAGAGLLVLGGAGAAIYRRARRDERPAGPSATR
jgi:hypothetical protein